MRYYAVAALVVAAAVSWAMSRPSQPTPVPPVGGLQLAGLFRGENAADDAALLAALADELADEIEADGMAAEPILKTGVQLDTLRTRARQMRCRGRSIGDDQPAVRDAVATFLEQRLGTSGGPVTADQRSAWVIAYREIARAAEYAIR